MFVSEKLIYVELPKTACSQIRDLLKHLVGGQNVGKHNRLPKELINSDKAIIGSVRNPWDWYVSLWAFGCGKKGSLYKRLTSRKPKDNGLIGSYASAIRPHSIFPILLNNLLKPCDEWEHLYSDSKDPTLFREWLCRLLDTKSGSKYTFGNGYALSPVSSYAGIYTFYYLQLFLQNDFDLFGDRAKDFDSLRSLDEESNILDYVIRTENLEQDLIEMLDAVGFEFENASDTIGEVRSFKPSWHRDKDKPTNASSRVRDFRYYYDSDTSELVYQLEKHIISKYEYSYLDDPKSRKIV